MGSVSGFFCFVRTGKDSGAVFTAEVAAGGGVEYVGFHVAPEGFGRFIFGFEIHMPYIRSHDNNTGISVYLQADGEYTV